MSGMFRGSVSAFAAVLFIALFYATPAWAANITVNSTDDTPTDGECTLREAVAAANTDTATGGCAAGSGADTITFDLPNSSKITLTKEGGPPALIEVFESLTIDGADKNVTISGGGEVGIFFNSGSASGPATLTLKNLTLSDGRGLDFGSGFGGGSSGGGSVYNVATLIVEGVDFINNRAFDAGGAIYSRGARANASVTGSTFEGNYVTCSSVCDAHGGGGAIAALAGGETEISDSVFSGNTAFGKGASGGAILGRRTFNENFTGPISVSGSYFENNKSLTAAVLDDRFIPGGGAVSVLNHKLTITDSEFTENEATIADFSGNPGGGFVQQAFGGAILVEGEAVPGGGVPELKPTEILDTTFTNNAATAPQSFGGAMLVFRAPTSITRTTFTQNTAERTGAIDNAGASLEISDSKLTDNVAIGRDKGFTAGGVFTRSQGTDGARFEAKTTFTGTEVSNNVNGNCATGPDEELKDNGGNSESPGASCGFNDEPRVETERPDALDDEFEGAGGTATVSVPAPGILGNDTDPEGEAMIPELVSEPRNGTVVLEEDGSFVYTPNEGSPGDTFTYRVKSPDGLRQSRVASARISLVSDIVVNSEADVVDAEDGRCTLREAVASANTNSVSGSADGECAAGSGRDEITFDLPEGAEITLGGEMIEISSSMVLDGSGADALTVSGGDESRVFFVRDGSVEIADLSITGGAATGSGGAIFNLADLTLTNTVVSGNSSNFGGAIKNGNGPGGDKSVNGDDPEGDEENEFVVASLAVRGGEFTSNTSGGNGGAIYNDFGSLTVEDSTFSENTAEGGGGGVYILSEFVNDSNPEPRDLATIKNSTFSENTADSGGGVFNAFGLTIIENSTITKNTADQGSGAASAGEGLLRTEIHSSIIAANENTDVDFAFGDANTFLSKGHNLIGSGNAAEGESNAFDETGDRTNVSDPGLEPLSDNEGPTETHALKAGSPALDAGDPECSLLTDQRGMERPKDGDGDGEDVCDIGAFEAQSPPAQSPPPQNPKPNPSRCTIVGTPGGDVLRGTPRRDVICGLGGDDVIRGMGGNDVIRGGSGDDLIFGGAGNDRVLGGAGDDFLRGGAGNDRLIGGAGRDVLRGEGGSDKLFARDGVRGNDIANGGPGRDRCAADRGDVRRNCP